MGVLDMAPLASNGGRPNDLTQMFRKENLHRLNRCGRTRKIICEDEAPLLEGYGQLLARGQKRWAVDRTHTQNGRQKKSPITR